MRRRLFSEENSNRFPCTAQPTVSLHFPLLSYVFRSQCDDIDRYFRDVNSVSEIDLGSVIRVNCPENDGYRNIMLEEILIESGKTLTIKSTQDYVR